MQSAMTLCMQFGMTLMKEIVEMALLCFGKHKQTGLFDMINIAVGPAFGKCKSIDLFVMTTTVAGPYFGKCKQTDPLE